MKFLVRPRYSLWDIAIIVGGSMIIVSNPSMIAFILFMVFIGMLVGAYMKDMLGE